jgi:hypothetical protein
MSSCRDPQDLPAEGVRDYPETNEKEVIIKG